MVILMENNQQSGQFYLSRLAFIIDILGLILLMPSYWVVVWSTLVYHWLGTVYFSVYLFMLIISTTLYVRSIIFFKKHGIRWDLLFWMRLLIHVVSCVAILLLASTVLFA